jgi:serine/threonine protein kinase
MTPPDPERVHEIFDAMLDLPPSSWDESLPEACDGDEDLIQEVRSILDAHLAADATRVSPRQERSPSSEATDMDFSARGFRLVRSLGIGGMGRVWEAVQETPNRVVAIKVLRWGSLSGDETERFLREIDLLGRISHPNVSQIFEAGSIDSGEEKVPYFVMEHVDGARTIVEYCHEHKLDRNAMLDLFLVICRGVQAGHDLGIVHRDLKPSNILVDRHGKVKIIDFGLARPTPGDAPQEVDLTRSTQILGTLQYMSPEQCEGGSTSITRSSDVYSLGILLYELLCGDTPYTVQNMPFLEAVKVIRQLEPVRPSSHSRSLRGDLETILDKSLTKLPSRRYADAGELAADIERFLRNEPITAVPPSATYKAIRFVQRNRNPVVWSAALIVVIVASMIGLGMLKSQETKASRLQGHLANLIVEQVREANPLSNPDAPHSPNMAHEVADLLASLDELGLKDPPMAIRLQLEIARTFEGSGAWKEARKHYGKAVDLCDRSNHASGDDCDQAMLGIASTQVKLGELSAARETLAGLLEERGEDRPLNPRLQVVAAHLQAELMSSNIDLRSANALAEEAYARMIEIAPGDDAQSEAMELALAITLADTGRHEEAIQMARGLHARQGMRLGADAPATLQTAVELARVLDFTGENEEAGRLMKESVAAYVRRLGENHPDTLFARSAFGLHLINQSRLAEARKQLELVVHRTEETLGPNHRLALQANYRLACLIYLEGDVEGNHETAINLMRDIIARCDESSLVISLDARSELGIWLATRGSFEEAEATLDEVRDLYDRNLGPDHPRVIETAKKQILVSYFKGDHAGQIEIIEENIERATRSLGAEHPLTLQLRHDRALTLGPRLGRWQEGFAALRSVTSDTVKALGPSHRLSLNARRNFVTAMTHMGQAAAGREEAIQLMEDARTAYGPSAPITLQTTASCGFLLGRLGEVESAQEILEPAIVHAEETLGPNHDITLDILGTLASIELFNNEFSKGAVSFKALADRRSDLLGPTHPNTIGSRSNEAHCLGKSGKSDEALAIYSTLLPTMRDALPAGAPPTMNALIRSGMLLAERGESAEAEARIREGVIGLDRSMQKTPVFWKVVDEIRSRLAEHADLLKRLDLPVRDSTLANVETP